MKFIRLSFKYINKRSMLCFFGRVSIIFLIKLCHCSNPKPWVALCFYYNHLAAHVPFQVMWIHQWFSPMTCKVYLESAEVPKLIWSHWSCDFKRNVITLLYFFLPLFYLTSPAVFFQKSPEFVLFAAMNVSYSIVVHVYFSTILY